jgi:protein TonB
MPLRCLLFCADPEAASLLVRILEELRIDAEHCPSSVTATERVTSQPFQIVILDWDDQPDAGLLLGVARTRKAAERPLTLAIVGDDAGVPKALQAGANSILRKPLLVTHVRDTLTTARDLLRAKIEQSVSTAKAAVAKASASPLPAVVLSRVPTSEQTSLRKGEFLHASAPQPGAQFSTEADLEKNLIESPAPAEIDPLEELEPTAGALNRKNEVPSTPAAPPAPARGLAWYKARNSASSGAAAAAAPALAPTPSLTPAQPPAAKAQLPGYDLSRSHSATPAPSSTKPVEVTPISVVAETSVGQAGKQRAQNDEKAESELFAYMEAEQGEKPKPGTARSGSSPSGFLKILAVLGVAALCAGTAYWMMPQRLWKPGLQRVSKRVTGAVHAWLNPQPVTPAQVPVTHENFARAGDEYKMPAAEPIPDATTDPSQIHVLPVIDPTAKQPHAASANANQATSPDTSGATVVEQPPAGAARSPEESTTQPATPPTANNASAVPANATPPAVKTYVAPAPQRSVPPQSTAAGGGIPTSLQSQMASSTPEAGGNKPPEAAMASIEPVSVPEAAARSLLQQQPAPAYPESAKGQSGTVVLQVLIGRDGSVQDAKFMQGSLVFARAAIDAVKQWRFQPYTMNGRHVSVVTSLTVSFKPAS